jgi:predicted enzyme related to lactoylglutathione lyase
MIAGARYVHTNLIARDWRRLAAFYESVFGCVPLPPERDYSGPVFDAGTGVKGARLEDGPAPAVNRPGFSHIAFAVDSVEDARTECLAAGGTAVGDVVTLTTMAGSKVTWCYLADPEGNIVELQRWD